MLRGRREVEIGLEAIRVPALKGARIPSMAEDVATDLSTLRLRAAGLRR